jgi:hypothetical protein
MQRRSDIQNSNTHNGRYDRQEATIIYRCQLDHAFCILMKIQGEVAGYPLFFSVFSIKHWKKNSSILKLSNSAFFKRTRIFEYPFETQRQAREINGESTEL